MNATARPHIVALIPDESVDGLRGGASAVDAEVTVVPTVGALLERLRGETWAATILSLSHDAVGEALASRISGESSSGALILSAPGASLDAALLAERAGAVGLLREPLEASVVEARLRQVLDEGTAVALPTLPEDSGISSASLVGESAAMAEVFEMIARVASSTSTVLLTGESGTGKEVVARALHDVSDRRDRPFIAVNCAAIPEHLLESELFGHEKGAFTGAIAERRGRFERADGGTLFLDEIGDMSLVLQAKVLRVLEERTVERVGGESVSAVDVRVIAATNQVLADAIAEGRFREDLYYRLAVVEISLPPLRDRGSDVRSLALHFATHFAERHSRTIRAISGQALARLEGAPWPGNVRELRNVIDRAVLLTSGDVIRSSALRLGSAAPRSSSQAREEAVPGYPDTASLAAVEADHIRRVLASVDGQVTKAAAVLGIHRNTLTRKVQEYDIALASDPGDER